jgi:hypothetical protein
MLLPSHDLKIRQAQKHIKTLRQIAPAGGNQNPLVREYDDVTGHYTVRLAPLDDFSLIVGDTVQCIRASLNHVVYELALVRTAGQPLPKKVVEGLEFPIFWERSPTQAQITKKIGAIDPGAQAIILGLQPHLAGADYVKDQLYWLNELARIDRHRLILPGVYIASPDAMGIGGNFFAERMEIHPGRTAPDAVVAEGVVRRIRPDVPVQVHLTMTAHIVFGEGPCDGQDAVEVLIGLIEYASNSVIGPLLPYLRP